MANNSTRYCYSKKLGTRKKLGPEYYAKSGVVTQLELYLSYHWCIMAAGKWLQGTPIIYTNKLILLCKIGHYIVICVSTIS